jgi:hypothetical protein
VYGAILLLRLMRWWTRVWRHRTATPGRVRPWLPPLPGTSAWLPPPLPARLPLVTLQDLAKDAAPYFAKARKFYQSVAAELVAHGHALDIFNCSLDQIGMAEMRDMVQLTGGMAVQTDTYHNPVFKVGRRGRGLGSCELHDLASAESNSQAFNSLVSHCSLACIWRCGIRTALLQFSEACSRVP